MFNNYSPFNLYNQKITVLNKIKGQDNSTGSDLWVKTVVRGVLWKVQKQSTFNSNGSTVFGTTVLVYFSDMNKYKPYKDFILYGSDNDFYTLSLGDYLILGDVFEDIESKTITETLNKYRPNVCQIRSIMPVQERGINRVKLVAEGV